MNFVSSLDFPLDFDVCANLLRTVTDAIAQDGPRRARAVPIADQVAHVRDVGEQASAQLRAALRARYPDIGWRGEDDASYGDTGLYWVYDPVDGAYHYLQGLPLWAATLALVKDGRAVAAFVYDPVMQDMFMAGEGTGAWSGSAAGASPLQVSAKTELASTVVGTAVPPVLQVGAQAQRHALRLFDAVAGKVFVLRPMAAASLQLAYVAAGLLDAYWETGNDATDWLAGALLVQEAGGTVTDFDGHAMHAASRGIVAANGTLGGQLRAVLAH